MIGYCHYKRLFSRNHKSLSGQDWDALAKLCRKLSSASVHSMGRNKCHQCQLNQHENFPQIITLAILRVKLKVNQTTVFPSVQCGLDAKRSPFFVKSGFDGETLYEEVCPKLADGTKAVPQLGKVCRYSQSKVPQDRGLDVQMLSAEHPEN